MGIMMVVHPDGTTKTEMIRRAPRLQDMQALVGGMIESVPLVDHRAVGEGDKQRVVAFCNEEGKLHGLPVNPEATRMWHKSVGTNYPDVLVGTVIFLWGDAAFMRSL